MARETELIKRQLVEEIASDGASPVLKVARRVGVSRQAVDKQLRSLIRQGIVLVEGEGKKSRYFLPVLADLRRHYRLADGLEEHIVWRDLVVSALVGLSPIEVTTIAYGFNELLNNAIEHSQAAEVIVAIHRNVNGVTVQIRDDGVGVFKKVADAFRLSSLEEALFEVSKGKLTTEPARHNGEGIFFSARLFDAFILSANNLSLMHNANVKDGWLVQAGEQDVPGTRASFVLNLPSMRNIEKVFAEHVANRGDFGFTKTHVLLKLAQLGERVLISRSHARRVVWRLERFAQVVLDFEGVERVGPTFVDELFRVFPGKKPNVKLLVVNANENIQQMISGTSADAASSSS